MGGDERLIGEGHEDSVRWRVGRRQSDLERTREAPFGVGIPGS